MVKVDLVGQIWCVLSVMGGVELRARKGIIEDTGDPGWNAESSYLYYEEPEYNQSEGFTKDDFTDNLKGFQTQPTLARTFGWEMSAFGEFPFAALLVSVNTFTYENRFCMGTVITRRAVVVPCACMRRFGEYLLKPNKAAWEKYAVDAWYRRTKLRPPDYTYKYYQYKYSLELNIEVVANNVEFSESNIGKRIYPRVNNVFEDLCWTTWSYFPAEGRSHDGYNRYRQLFHPAIAILSKKLSYEAVVPWPPFTLDYRYFNGTYEGDDGQTKHFFYSNHLEEGKQTPAVISSFRFFPLEETYLSVDNDARRKIRVEDHLVNLRVELCNQNLCNVSEGFEMMNDYWVNANKLQGMLCWCDVPWVGDEAVYQNMKTEETAPVYVKSVYGGLYGAPVIHNGQWLGWTVDLLGEGVEKGATRSVWSRNVDKEMIAYFEKKLPELNNKKHRFDNNPDDDVNRRSFALRDFKDFVPDTFLEETDVDLAGWAQPGEPRFLRLKSPHSRGYSGASAILPTLVLTLSSTFLHQIPLLMFLPHLSSPPQFDHPTIPLVS